MHKWFWRGIWLLLLVATAGAILVYRWQFGSDFAVEHSNWGEFGDYVGGVLGPVFSFLALIVLVYTLEVQTRQFSLQNFERGFFELVRLHHDIVRDLEVSVPRTPFDVVGYRPQEIDPPPTVRGRDCFGVLVGEFFGHLSTCYEAKKEGLEALECTQIAYSKFREGYRNEVDHYFRHLHHILKFVDEGPVDDKHKYTRILRAQLSADELLLLFYSSLHPVGGKSRKYLTEYAMLHNLDRSTLYDRATEEKLHDNAAYGPEEL